MDTLHIASAADARFFPGLALTLGSAILASSGTRAYRVTVIDGGFSPEQRDRLTAWLERIGESVETPVRVDYTAVGHPMFQRFPERRGSRLAFGRLVIPFLFPDEDVVYVDSDTLCLKGLEGFAEGAGDPDAALVAIQDPLGTGAGDRTVRRELGGAERKKPYFNSGIVLLRCAQLNALGFQEEILSMLDRIPEPRYADQSLLNIMLRDHWRAVPREFNYLLTLEQATEFVESPFPANLHFIGPRKPWMPVPSRFYRYFTDRMWHRLNQVPGEPRGEATVDEATLARARRVAVLHRLFRPRRSRLYARAVHTFEAQRRAGFENLATRLASHPELRPAVAAALMRDSE